MSFNVFPDRDWNLANDQGEIDWDRVSIAVLMDIRSELRRLNQVLRCHNFVSIPVSLRKIARNTIQPSVVTKATRKRS